MQIQVLSVLPTYHPTKQVRQISLFLVDDHPTVRAGIRTLLDTQDTFHVVGEASDATEALKKLPELNPDIAILDLSLPDIDGIELARRLGESSPHIKLIALSLYDDPEHIRGFLSVGGMAYIAKANVAEQLLKAVSEVEQGRYYLPAKYHMQLAEELKKNGPSKNLELTKREARVLDLMAQGLTFQEIGERLSISAKTAATYRQRAAEKLDIKTRAGLMKWVFEHPSV